MDLEVKLISRIPLSLMKKIVVLEEEAFGRGGLNEWHLPFIGRHGRLFILKKDGEPIGLAELIKDWQEPETAFLIGFTIKKGERGKGRGYFFFKEIIKQISLEIKTLYLTVSPKNLSALHLYEKFGFTKEKFLKNEYGEGEDRWLLKLELQRI